MPFEAKEINIKKDGFLITFTKPVDKELAANADAYKITTYTYIYHGSYGSPEVDQTTARVTEAIPSADGLSVMVRLEKITEDHIHDFDLSNVKSQDGHPLLHNKAYYTVNEIPQKLTAYQPCIHQSAASSVPPPLSCSAAMAVPRTVLNG